MTTHLQAAMLKKFARDELTCLNGAEPDSHHEAATFADMVIETS